MIGRVERLGTYAVLGAAPCCLYPLGEVLWLAVQPDADRRPRPHPRELRHRLDRGQFGTYLRNSVVVSGSVVAVATVLSSLAGYAFGTMRFPGATALFYLLLVGLMVPSEAVVIPLYFTFSTWA